MFPTVQADSTLTPNTIHSSRAAHLFSVYVHCPSIEFLETPHVKMKINHHTTISLTNMLEEILYVYGEEGPKYVVEPLFRIEKKLTDMQKYIRNRKFSRKRSLKKMLS